MKASDEESSDIYNTSFGVYNNVCLLLSSGSSVSSEPYQHEEKMGHLAPVETILSDRCQSADQFYDEIFYEGTSQVNNLIKFLDNKVIKKKKNKFFSRPLCVSLTIE